MDVKKAMKELNEAIKAVEDLAVDGEVNTAVHHCKTALGAAKEHLQKAAAFFELKTKSAEDAAKESHKGPEKAKEK